jgi:hypothetical protein
MTYDCPAGSRWATVAEGRSSGLLGSKDGAGSGNHYWNQCGWDKYKYPPGSSPDRIYFRYADSTLANGLYTPAGDDDEVIRTDSGGKTTRNFAGIVCAQELEWLATTPNWMLTTDDCHGFRASRNMLGSELSGAGAGSQMFFAVSQSTTWRPDYQYDCPAGFRWARSMEAHAHGADGVGSQASGRGNHYWNQCGWDKYKYPPGSSTPDRIYFRYADSTLANGLYLPAGDDDEVIRTDSGGKTTRNFAGIVCTPG